MQLLDSLFAGAGNRLVGTDINAFDADGIMDRLQRHHHLDGGAVGVGDDAPVGILGDGIGVDLRHHQRDVIVIAELGGVVDNDATGRRRLGRIDGRDRRPR